MLWAEPVPRERHVCILFKILSTEKGGGKECAHFYVHLGDLTQNLVKKLTLEALQMTYIAL